VGINPHSVVTGDFNGDGRPDLAVANNTDNTVNVLFGRGDGTFANTKTYNVCRSPMAIATADLNGDGRPDLIAVCRSLPGKDLAVVLNSTAGFLPPKGYPDGGETATSLAVADFDEDGIPDIVVGDSDFISFLKGNGDGSFQAPSVYSAGADVLSLAVGDFNNDGKLDIACADADIGADILLGNGDGTFQAPTYLSDGSKPLSITTGDFNHDGNADIVLADAANSASVFQGNGDSTFQPAVSYRVGKAPRSVAVGDFNGDGALDVAVAVHGGVTVMYGRGDGTFPVLRQFAAHDAPWSLAVGDFNHDRAMDLAVANDGSNDVSVLMNSGGTFVSATSSENPAPAGQPVTFTATVAASLTSTIPTGTVQFADGTTILATVPLDQNGVASYTTSGLSEGTHTIRTKYSGDSNFNPNMGPPISEVIQ